VGCLGQGARFAFIFPYLLPYQVLNQAAIF